jgi:hypothetical protein
VFSQIPKVEMTMISTYTEVEFCISNFDDFDAETTRVVDELFDLETASQEVYDAGAGGNTRTQHVHLTLFADGETVEEATGKALRVIFKAVENASTTTWTWKTTRTEDPASDTELEILSSQVAV